jgi:N-acetylneuraminic acid mutarotase
MGDKMLVIGGGNGETTRFDGAVFDAPSDSWRKVAPAPAPIGDAVGAWTGHEAIILTGEGASVTASAYDPATNSWRTLPSPPITNAASAIAHAVWTGTELLVISTSGGDDGHDLANHAAIYDPQTNRWRPIAVPAEPFPNFGDAVWTGDRLAVVGTVNQSGSSTGNNTLLVYDPASDQWHIVAWQLPGTRTNPVVAWTGNRLFIGGGGSAYAPPTLSDAALVDVGTGTWTRVPDAPVTFAGNSRFGELWTGREVLTLDGAQTRPVAFDPATQAWHIGPPSPNGTRRAEAGWSWLPSRHAAVVWGGGTTNGAATGTVSCCTPLGDGLRYTP